MGSAGCGVVGAGNGCVVREERVGQGEEQEGEDSAEGGEVVFGQEAGDAWGVIGVLELEMVGRADLDFAGLVGAGEGEGQGGVENGGADGDEWVGLVLGGGTAEGGGREGRSEDGGEIVADARPVIC